jgi:hypothetical protein
VIILISPLWAISCFLLIYICWHWPKHSWLLFSSPPMLLLPNNYLINKLIVFTITLGTLALPLQSCLVPRLNLPSLTCGTPQLFGWHLIGMLIFCILFGWKLTFDSHSWSPTKALSSLATPCGVEFLRHGLWRATFCYKWSVVGVVCHPNNPYIVIAITF